MAEHKQKIQTEIVRLEIKREIITERIALLYGEIERLETDPIGNTDRAFTDTIIINPEEATK